MTRTVLVGSDQNTIWMLPWFLKHFREHNPDMHLTFADFGDIDKESWRLLECSGASLISRETLPEHLKGWHLKPFAIREALKDCDQVLWLDLDIEVRATIGHIFQTRGKLAMSPDPFLPNRWLARPQRYCTPKKKFKWNASNYVFNTGCVLARQCKLLNLWCDMILHGKFRSDEEAFAALVRTGDKGVTTFPRTVQWLRLYPDRWKKGAILWHYTGQEGHNQIRYEIMSERE